MWLKHEAVLDLACVASGFVLRTIAGGVSPNLVPARAQAAADIRLPVGLTLETVEGSFADNVRRVPWMDDGTRARALEKAAAVANKVGFPDRWRNDMARVGATSFRVAKRRPVFVQSHG